MTQQPLSRAPYATLTPHHTVIIQNDSGVHCARNTAPRVHFSRSALFTALATSLIGIAPAALADTTNYSNYSNDANQPTTNQVADDEATTLSADDNLPENNQPADDTESDSQLDAALDALRLKKAVEQGIIEQSVLDDYREQTLGIKKSNANSVSSQNSSTQPNSLKSSSTQNSSSAQDEDVFDEDAALQAAVLQQQGYQMMTPEQIDREMAALDLENAQDINGINNQNNSSNNDSDFDVPVAMLADTSPPIGLDIDLDATSVPTPSNLETLGQSDSNIEQAAATTLSRPTTVTDSVSNGRANQENGTSNTDNITVENAITNDEAMTVSDDVAASDNTGSESGTTADIINPDDYLPDYQTDTQVVDQSINATEQKKPRARNRGNIVKRLYNRFFGDGVIALPNVETTIYLQQAADKNSDIKDDDIKNSADSGLMGTRSTNLDATSDKVKLIEADTDVQPMKNIKAALDETTVQSLVDFTAALPRLRQTAMDAAKAVGYYEVNLRLRQPNRDTIEVIIEDLGEPVLVDSRIVEIRGEGSEQEEFIALQEDLPPQEGDVFNHRVYKSSKAALEALSNTYGYFDQYWLNKSVDIILPDNKADVSLVYNTGDRYEFDDVVFFTYDAKTNTLTQDPDKLPVELSLLQQLYGFTPGQPFYRPDVTKFSNDLSATRYFNTVNVESILPPDDSSRTSTLAFDNAPNNSSNTLDDDVDSGDGSEAINNSDNEVLTAFKNGQASAENTSNDNSDIGAAGNSISGSSSGETVNPADIAAIEFEADEATLDKLKAIQQKADRLSRLPNDRVLDEKQQETDSILGKISDSITNVAQKIFPDEVSILADENFVPPTLAGRKTPQEVAESKKIPLYVFVAANKPRDAQVGLGYGTDTGVRATAKIDYNLLNRQGYQAGAETEVSRISKNVAVYASRPWNHPLNDKLDARLTYEEEVIDQGEGNFDLSTKTLKAALARNIRRDNGWNRSYSVRYRLDELETGVDGAALDDLPIRFTSSSPKQRALLFGYGMNKTEVDNATNPTQGIRQYYSIEAGSDAALSDTDLAIVRAGVSGIYSFGEDKKHQVLGSVNTGYIWADDFYDVPYKLRFFAGGDQSIRGYDYESLSPLDKGYLTGGQILAVGSAEYNYEFKPGFRGAFFTDVGNAYDKDFETETKVGVGVGIRWASPVGMVRVDVAAGVTEESIPVRLHFFIGSPL
ncbi:autotransporter assembly complex protein TamA [Psychrobacter sp. NG27]|uniref:autotransporter assembly complex protein TamA n=1 Tax=Psychrobacter sp. NG27 TaxID=2781966 RepID=UPI0018E02D02|nr:BamA/TamA family outer membrane protein [Psychrobacter sp. NG27]MBI0425542.1 BamA/TamA family outer membrane protein [Psychrobacter sp. NG27]